MARPTLLVGETEPIQALSVRKLVLETAKFNVLTAHSREEILEIVNLFPAISAVIVSDDKELDCEGTIAAVKRRLKKVPIIVVVPGLARQCAGADFHVSSYEPEKLLELMRSLLGDPRDIPGAKTQGAKPRKKSP
jgi:hypothetical protein